MRLGYFASIDFVPPRILATHWEAVARGAGRAGRAADRSAWRISRDVYVADTDAEARREALAGPLARDDRDYFLPLLGSPDTVAAKLQRLGAEVGGSGTLLVIAHEWRPRAARERSRTLLKEQVLPRLAA